MKYVRGFDGLRALAVLAVFLTHRSPLYSTNLGAIGVLLFFVLSGFLVGGILHDQRRKMETSDTQFWPALGGFMQRRMLRIAPIYYLSIAVVAGAALLGYQADGWRWDAVPWALIYALNIYQGAIDLWVPPISHFWSLAIEMQFYLLMAPVLLLTSARRHGPICLAIVGVAIATAAVRLALGSPYIAVYSDTLINFGLLALGTFMRLKSQTWRLPRAGLMTWIGAAGVLAIALMPHHPIPTEVLIIVALGGIASSILILAVFQAQEGLMVRLLQLPPMLYLGRISYGFYVYHELFRLKFGGEGAVDNLLRFSSNLAVSLLLAAASWHFIESPLTKLGHGARARVAKSAPETA